MRISTALLFVVSLVISLLAAQHARSATISAVLVGDPGNANDPATGNLYGGVNYVYGIGKYEVTVGQYTEFLNAVAATDTYSLYNTSMATELSIAGIARNGVSGSYSYSVIGSANHPITYVNWGDAARFANWLNNGQPSGPQNASTTEDGAYTLNGASSDAALYSVTRNANAKWFLPSENEWYKAAYYQPAAQGGDADSYWKFPMKTNSFPYSAPPPGNSAPDNTRVSNFYNYDGQGNSYDNGFGATGSPFVSPTQNLLTDVGAYTSSPSYYGTFDQSGNVNEWNEAQIPGYGRGSRGGSWHEVSPYSDDSSLRGGGDPWTYEYNTLGFRVATSAVPEPSMAALVGAMSGIGLLWRRRSQSRS